MAVMFLYVVAYFKEMGREIIVHHKFLIPVYTHMEADTIHAAIEKQKKHTSIDIELPRDWAILISTVQINPPIKVVQMKQVSFFNFKNVITSMYVHKKVNANGEPVCWNKLRWMKYTADNVGKVLYKHSFSNNEEESFKVLDLTKKTRRSSELIDLQPLHSKLLPLSKEKLNELSSLLPYINETSRQIFTMH